MTKLKPATSRENDNNGQEEQNGKDDKNQTLPAEDKKEVPNTPKLHRLFVHLGRDCTHGRAKDGQEFWISKSQSLEGQGSYVGSTQEVEIICEDGVALCQACVLDECQMCIELLEADFGKDSPAEEVAHIPRLLGAFLHLGRDCTHGLSKDGKEFWISQGHVLKGRGSYAGATQEVGIVFEDGIKLCQACVWDECQMCTELLEAAFRKDSPALD